MSTTATENLPATSSRPSSPPSPGGLITDHGSTSISDDVVSKVAEMAAREVRGVHELSGGIGGQLRRFTPGLDTRGAGASVEVGEKEAIVDLDLVVDYGVSIPQLATAVRDNVIDRLEFITGLKVKEVNLEISDLFFAEDERRKEAEKAQKARENTSRVE